MMKKSCLFIKKRLGFAVLVISLAMLLGCSMASVTTHKKNQEAADDECDVSVFLRCSIVCQQENRQKLKQEFNCAENHI